jgi:hypothetical protein
MLGQVPGLTYEVYPARAKPGRDRPLVTCGGACRLALRPGKYRVRLRSTPTTSGGERLFEIEESSQVLVSPRSSAAAYFGLSLGIVGSVAVFSGAVLLGPSVISANCHDGDRCEDHETQGAIGLGLLVAGAVATPIGWRMFARNLRPRAEVIPLSADEARSHAPVGALSVAPSLTRHVLGLRAEVIF